jgi:hypothetical protein
MILTRFPRFSFGCMLYKLLKGHSPFRQHKTKVNQASITSLFPRHTHLTHFTLLQFSRQTHLTRFSLLQILRLAYFLDMKLIKAFSFVANFSFYLQGILHLAYFLDTPIEHIFLCKKMYFRVCALQVILFHTLKRALQS